MKAVVGRFDGKPLSKEESGIQKECKQRRFKTEQEAIDYLNQHLFGVNPKGVERGDYYLEREGENEARS